MICGRRCGPACPPLEQRAAVRFGCINAAVSAARAVEIVYNLGGSDSIFEKHPLERCFRDVHAATQHGAVAPKGLRWPAAFSWGWNRKDLSN
jgi:acyl-CoA dehydrogenase-like protein